jgi:two-component system nitrate/nitrite sensor histidine kinase NarX
VLVRGEDAFEAWVVRQHHEAPDSPVCAYTAGVLVRFVNVQDDGTGFDPIDVSPDSLGLGIMWERLEAIGATLKIESEPGQGTRIILLWQNDGKERP